MPVFVIEALIIRFIEIGKTGEGTHRLPENGDEFSFRDVKIEKGHGSPVGSCVTALPPLPIC